MTDLKPKIMFKFDEDSGIGGYDWRFSTSEILLIKTIEKVVNNMSNLNSNDIVMLEKMSQKSFYDNI